MSTIGEIKSAINDWAQFDTAEAFDNVGILIGDSFFDVKRCLVCLDVTQAVCDEAAGLGAELIISHHPVIFEPLKRISSADVVYQLIQEGISVLSAHTNLDRAKNGVNEVLINTLKLKNAVPVESTDGLLYKCETSKMMSAEELAKSVKENLNVPYVRLYDAGFPIETVAVCCGSGGSFFNVANEAQVDAMITGDVKHDVAINAFNNGVTLIDAGHYETECMIVDKIIDYLTPLFSDVEFLKSQSDGPIFKTL